MYGSGTFSTFLYGSLSNGKTSESTFSIDLIGFNSYSFSDIIISNIPDTHDKNTFDLQTYQLSTHGQGFSNWLIRDKTLTIEGWILAENDSELEKKIEKIKSNLLVGEGTLYIKKNNGILQTKATVIKLELPRESWTINTAKITITFKILDPFFYSTKQKEVGYFDINANLNATLIYSSGTHEAKPSVFIAFKEAEYVNQITLKINDKTLVVNQSIKTGDSLSINAEKLDVAKNGKYGIDRIGEFGELKSGENDISILINGEFNTEIFIKYRDTYV